MILLKKITTFPTDKNYQNKVIVFFMATVQKLKFYLMHCNEFSSLNIGFLEGIASLDFPLPVKHAVRPII